MTDPIYLKALGPGRTAINGGTGTWPEPGTWTPNINPIPCKQGWHVCTPTQMLDWLPDTTNDIWLVEIDGTIVTHDNDKTVAQRARLIRKLDWTDRTARLFAADCAEAVLPIYEAAYPGDNRPRTAINVARRYALGEATNEERAAARAAAWDAVRAARAAAWDAAWAAARAAARAADWDADWAAAGDAARDAARAAAWAAAGDADWDAARAAAGDAAWDAARAAQGELLVKHLLTETTETTDTTEADDE